MKMPPEEWGGLWLLHELRKGGWNIPAIALSGEGSKRQVIEAQRLGANTWVDKEDAGDELLDQCTMLLTASFGQAVARASAKLPTPIAYRFARYARMIDPEKRISEGLRTLEAVLRFAALIGLSGTPPQPLLGITVEKIKAPSMRTWFDLCTALDRAPNAAIDFTRLLSFLLPDRAHRQLIQDLISIRNDIAHGRATADHIEGQGLDNLLRRFAHRAHSAWRADIAVPTTMRYDGSSYCIDVLRLNGTGAPSPDVIKSQIPIVTGELVLLSPEAKLLPLTPWLIAQKMDDLDNLQCLLFDGLQYTKGNPIASTPFKYSKIGEGKRPRTTTTHSGGIWQSLAPWTTR
jgi:CheY-like chemotaxis protein